MTKTIYIFTLSFFSFCSIGQTTVYSEDFQNGLPTDFTVIDNDGLTPAPAVSNYTAAWIELVDPTNTSDTMVGSTSFFSPVGQADRWLITPKIGLSDYGNILYWDAKSQDPSYPDSYMVLASKTDNALTSFTDTLLYVNDELFEWNYREVNLSQAGLNNDSVHIAFVNRTNDGFQLYIDSISVVTNDPVGLQSPEVSWVSVSPNPATDFVHIKGRFDCAELYTSSGVCIEKITNSTLDLTSRSKGVYMLRIFNEGHSQFERIVVQ